MAANELCPFGGPHSSQTAAGEIGALCTTKTPLALQGLRDHDVIHGSPVV